VIIVLLIVKLDNKNKWLIYYLKPHMIILMLDIIPIFSNRYYFLYFFGYWV